jgi:1,5-anhydro-D-fructose reductase (1,5-anhydro-D-mannitol-forming)
MLVNWLVVGLGDVATKRVLPAILADSRSRLAGIVTRKSEKAMAYGVSSWRKLETALLACDADAVYIATPVFLHGPQTIASLRSGRHVLCEKPTAMTYAEACSMRDEALMTGRKFGVAYYRRMYPKVDRAKTLIESGSIGQPFMAEATLHDWVQPRDAADWRFHSSLSGGGPLYDVASHRIDLMNYIFGRPGRAEGFRSTLVQAITVEDNATIVIEYDCGVRSIVDVRWHSRIFRDEFRIRGTHGELMLTPLNDPVLVFPGGRETLPAPENPLCECVADFVSAVLNDSPMRSRGETAIVTDWITEQAFLRPGPRGTDST